VGEYMLAQPDEQATASHVEKKIADLLVEMLGEDPRGWERLAQTLEPHSMGSEAHRMLVLELEASERDCAPLSGKRLEATVEQAAAMVVEQLGDVGFLWSSGPGRNMELGIPSLACYLAE